MNDKIIHWTRILSFITLKWKYFSTFLQWHQPFLSHLFNSWWVESKVICEYLCKDNFTHAFLSEGKSNKNETSIKCKPFLIICLFYQPNNKMWVPTNLSINFHHQGRRAENKLFTSKQKNMSSSGFLWSAKWIDLYYYKAWRGFKRYHLKFNFTLLAMAVQLSLGSHCNHTLSFATPKAKSKV